MTDTAPTIGTRELRGSLSASLRRARDGERIVVTVDGRPVAELGPVGANSGEVTLDDLIAVGLLDPPRRRDRPAPPEVSELAAGVSASRALAELRGR